MQNGDPQILHISMGSSRYIHISLDSSRYIYIYRCKQPLHTHNIDLETDSKSKFFFKRFFVPFALLNYLRHSFKYLFICHGREHIIWYALDFMFLL